MGGERDGDRQLCVDIGACGKQQVHELRAAVFRRHQQPRPPSLHAARRTDHIARNRLTQRAHTSTGGAQIGAGRAAARCVHGEGIRLTRSGPAQPRSATHCRARTGGSIPPAMLMRRDGGPRTHVAGRRRQRADAMPRRARARVRARSSAPVRLRARAACEYLVAGGAGVAGRTAPGWLTSARASSSRCATSAWPFIEA